MYLATIYDQLKGKERERERKKGRERERVSSKCKERERERVSSKCKAIKHSVDSNYTEYTLPRILEAVEIQNLQEAI